MKNTTITPANTLRLLGVFAAASFAFGALAAPTTPATTAPVFIPVVGQQYKLVQPSIPTEVATGKIEVIEFFSLGCPHCAEFEPYLDAWLKKKPAYIEFRRVPATFNPMFRMLARVHIALEDVGAADRLDPVIFEAIHGANKDPDVIRPLGEFQNLLSRGQEADAAEAEKAALDAIGRFVGARGVNAKKFKAALNSPSAMIKLGRADQTFRRYGVLGVPAMAINGKFFTTVGKPYQFKTFDELTATVGWLAEQEYKAMAPARPLPKPKPKTKPTAPATR